LFENYPNPFNPETTIRYEIGNTAHVEITIYNLLGEEIRHLVNEMQTAGRYDVRWDGTDNAGRKLASGVYLGKIKAGESVRVKKMMLVR